MSPHHMPATSKLATGGELVVAQSTAVLARLRKKSASIAFGFNKHNHFLRAHISRGSMAGCGTQRSVLVRAHRSLSSGVGIGLRSRLPRAGARSPHSLSGGRPDDGGCRMLASNLAQLSVGPLQRRCCGISVATSLRRCSSGPQAKGSHLGTHKIARRQTRAMMESSHSFGQHGFADAFSPSRGVGIRLGLAIPLPSLLRTFQRGRLALSANYRATLCFVCSRKRCVMHAVGGASGVCSCACLCCASASSEYRLCA